MEKTAGTMNFFSFCSQTRVVFTQRSCHRWKHRSLFKDHYANIKKLGKWADDT